MLLQIERGIWRYWVSLEEISPLYVQALLGYEDRWFYYHPGVNLVSLLRAAWQNLREGQIVSGGSTLTMQVARLLGATGRSIWGKCKQILRALQLEWHLSKKEILTLYLNLAPFGGPIEGVQAASYTYLGKAARELTHAEAALLAVLPQAPSRFRPDRHPQRAREARDKVLERLLAYDIWSAQIVKEAKAEPVRDTFRASAMLAPLLARRLFKKVKEQNLIKTFVDCNMQAFLEDEVRRYAGNLSDKTSVAVLVMENRTLAVKAYIGSANFADEDRFGHVDMIRALRSPGSTVKPFLYGLAIDEGLIHSKSLLSDAPQSFGDYRPLNFSQGFSGPVSVTEALQRSLNLPAVQVLEHLGSRKFFSSLKNAGMEIKFPPGGVPNLSLALGGFGTKLESLVGIYCSLARAGLAGTPRLASDDPLVERRVLSPGAAWIVRKILEENRRPDRPASHMMAYRGRLAWKTGTSFGCRDSWTVGVTNDYTVGVWVGRPDGSASPGYQGIDTAAPLLFATVEHLPTKAPDVAKPEEVTLQEVCWPLGTRSSDQPESYCHEHHNAWILRDQVPPTLKEPDDRWHANPLCLLVNPESGRMVDLRCNVERKETVYVALWPTSLEAWIPIRFRRNTQIPEYDPICDTRPHVPAQSLRILGMQNGSVLRVPRPAKTLPLTTLRAVGGIGHRFWFVDGDLINPGGGTEPVIYAFKSPGMHQIVVSDEQGNNDCVSVSVE